MQSIYNEFDNYVKNNFDINNYLIKLKYDHTYRVVNYAKRLVKSLNFNTHDCELAITCALLHDIARFKQIKEYNTFIDALSFDHGDEGYNILIKDNYINKFIQNDEDKFIVLNAVKNHNKKEIDSNLNERQLLFSKIVRDADKLDIMNKINIEINDNSNTINNNLLNEIKNKKICSNKYVSNQCEEIIRYLAFIFDINFLESYRIIKENDIINKRINILKENVINIDLDEIEILLNEYIINNLKKGE